MSFVSSMSSISPSQSSPPKTASSNSRAKRSTAPVNGAVNDMSLGDIQNSRTNGSSANFFGNSVANSTPPARGEQPTKHIYDRAPQDNSKKQPLPTSNNKWISGESAKVSPESTIVDENEARTLSGQTDYTSNDRRFMKEKYDNQSEAPDSQKRIPESIFERKAQDESEFENFSNSDAESPDKKPAKRFSRMKAMFGKRDISPSQPPAPRENVKKRSIGNVLHNMMRVMKTEDLSEDDVIIAVMGPTGSGKSSFINMATNLQYEGVGHSLESCTSEISIVKLESVELSDANIVFVDTPGFDDTHRSDVDILKLVSEWLKVTYQRKILLSGILYFHRISDNRMAGTPLKNLRMFEELCGKNSLQNIILTTTMWDEVEKEEGDMREEELKDKYWKDMLSRNSKTCRYLNTKESAWEVLKPLVQGANEQHAMLLQTEMVDLRMKLRETHAGQVLYMQLEELVTRQQDLLKRLRAETMRTQNEAVMADLRKEYDDIRKQLEVKMGELQEMKLSLGKRLLRVFNGLTSKRTKVK